MNTIKLFSSILVVGTVVLSLTSNAFAADLEKGKTLYNTYCTSCHGNEGAGDGPAGVNLPPAMKPANLQAGTFKKVTDDASMIDLLKKGGPALGLSPLMAPQSGMSDSDLSNVVAYVRSLKK